MAFDSYEVLGPELSWFDISGARGSLEFPLRSNILVMPKEYFFDEDILVLKVDQFSPEGYGYHRFHSDNLDIPAMEKLQDDVMVVWDVQSTMPPLGNLAWIVGVSEINEFDNFEGFTFQTVSDAIWLPVLNRQVSPPQIRLLEFCAGGYGGWKGATTFLQTQYNQQFQTIGIEIELRACLSYAVAHAATLCSAHELSSALKFSPDQNFIVCADLMNKQWWQAACAWNPHVVTISSSCKPWSTAALGQGLCRSDGLLLFKSILLCRLIQPPVICLEQVQGFSVHPHKEWIIRGLRYCGYQISWQGSLDLQDQAPTSRVRWLCIATRVSDNLSPLRIQPWNRVTGHTPISEDAVLSFNFPESKHLALSPDTADMAGNPKYHKTLRNRTVITPSEVLNSRINDGLAITPTFMAMYGSQHELDFTLLVRNGYFGHFKREEHFPFQCRYWHPLEIVLLHGHFGDVWLGDSLSHNFQFVGNMIAIPHALFVLLHVASIVGTTSLTPFWVFSQFRQLKMCASNLCIHHTKFGDLVTSGHFLMPNPVGHRPTPDNRIVNIESLFAAFTNDPSSIRCWSEQQGLNFCWQLSNVDEVPSAVSSPSQITPTCEFVPILTGRIQSDEVCICFGFSADIPPMCIADHWWGFFVPKMVDNPVDCDQIWWFPSDSPFQADETPCFAILMILGTDLTFVRAEDHQPLQNNPVIVRHDSILFDQFGTVRISDCPTRNMLLVDSPLQSGNLCHDLPYVFAAIRQVDIEREYIPSLDHVVLRFRGENQSVQVLSSLYQNGILPTTLEKLGRPAALRPISGGVELVFGNSQLAATCPPKAFDKALSVAVIRLLLNSLARHTGTSDDIPIVIKWHGRELWSGSIHPHTKMSVLITLIATGMVPIEDASSIRLISLGKRMCDEWRLGDYPQNAKGCIPIHLMFGLHGGGPSKNSQKIMHKNAIAGALIQHGYDMSWISTTVDTLINKFGISRLQSISALPMGGGKINAIQKLCKEAQIEVPNPTQPATGKFANGIPKKKRQSTVLNPLDFLVTPGFFLNEDKSEPPILQGIRGQTHGLCLVTPDQILPWLRENQSISSDELGAVVLGLLPLTTDLPTEEVTFPCQNSGGQSVLLTGTLVQLGEKKISFTKGDPKQVAEEPSVLMAITVFQSDFPAEQWNECLHNTSGFIKKYLNNESLGDALHSIWGRSLRQGNLPASPSQASSVQMHASIPASQVNKVLMKSGFNFVFCTPKERNGRVSSQYKIVWLEGSHSHATVQAAKTQHCLGLVRGKSNLGLRYHIDNYEMAWKVLFPGLKVPEKSVGDLIFKVEGLPFGCTPDTLMAWVGVIQWEAKPLKALGPQTWLFRSSVHPPPGLVMFNSHPVLVRHLPPKDQHQAPVIIGPKPRKTQQDGLDGGDPWASWTGPRLTPPVAPSIQRPTTGPIDTRLGDQDAKIQTLQTEIKKLAEGQEKFQHETNVMFKKVEAKDQQNMKEVRAAIGDLQKDFQTALANSIQENSKRMDTNFQELKALFRQSKSKRSSDDLGGSDADM